MPAGAFAEGKGRGQGRDSGLLNNPLFGERAALAASHDPVTGFDVLHIRRDFDHLSGGFQTGDKGRVGAKLIFALSHQQVREIEAGRMDPDSHFTVF